MLEQIRRWRWLILLLLFCVCVAFKLNGSSVGAWDSVLHDTRPRPPGLLLFKPQPIRSDEWQLWTPAALSQARQTPPFPIENFSLGPGRAPLLFNLPVAYYTTFFRPQLWGFFILDFERGFSFCWCCKVFGLLLTCAWLLRQIGVRSRSIVVLGTLWMFLPLQWWFSSPTMLPEMTACWAICTGCVIQMFTQASRWRTAVAVVAFFFFGVNFVLCLYPPGQVALLYVTAAVVTGVLFEQRRAGKTLYLKRGAIFVCAAALAIILTLVPFWIDMYPTVELVSQTVYPGARRSSGGRFSMFQLFAGLVSFFQTEKAFPKIYPNMCEAHHPLPLWPVVIFAVIVARCRRRIEISPLFITLGILVVCLALYCVFPFPGWLSRATLLSFVPEYRVVIAIGFANVFLTCLFLDRYRDRILTKRGAIVATAVVGATIAALLWTASLRMPGLFPDLQQIGFAFAATLVIIALFFLETRRFWFRAVLLTLLVVTDIWVNPVMSGLAPLMDSEAFKEIAKIRDRDPGAKWIFYYNLELPELVRATGAKIINGTKIVPDLEFLHRLDPPRQANFIYNRYAHIVCYLPPDPDQLGFFLVQTDSYVMEISPDLPILREIGCRYVAFPTYWPEAKERGFALIKVTSANQLWIYKRE
jgi:hypothetical protein